MEEEIAELADATAKEEAEKARIEAETAALQVDPVKQELEKVNKKKFTRRERLQFENKKINEQLSELDKEEGIEIPKEDDESMTVGKYKELKKSEGKKTALELAEAIEDESERGLIRHYLENRIVPSGNAEEDLKFARAAVNSLRNAQIAEEVERKKNAKGSPSAPGNPARHEDAFEATPNELVFMSPPYNLSKQDILKAREKELSK